MVDVEDTGQGLPGQEEEQPAQEQGPVGEEKSCPWEEISSIGFLNALGRTLRKSLFNPAQFFRRMPVGPGFWLPLGYAWLMGFLGLLIQFIWDSMFNFMSLLSEYPSEAGYSQLVSLFVLIAGPFWIPISIFIGALILHLCLLIVGGDRKGFEGTFRVVAYSTGVSVFGLVPFCGGAIAGIYGIVLEIIGLREVHGITTGRAAVAVLLPVMVCCGLGAVGMYFALMAGLLAGILQ